MAMERRQLCRNRENDQRRCVTTEAISQPYAAHGWSATYARSGIGACSVCVEPEPSHVAPSELIGYVLMMELNGKSKLRDSAEFGFLEVARGPSSQIRRADRSVVSRRVGCH